MSRGEAPTIYKTMERTEREKERNGEEMDTQGDTSMEDVVPQEEEEPIRVKYTR